MLTLRLSFPWGRYYAHPWGQNPARITEAEWPPSLWRLLRAIAAAWFQTNPGREPSPELIQTLEALGRELPTFVLPKVTFSRTIHYQPNYGATAKSDVALAKYKRVRHENHFAAVSGDVVVRWQLDRVDDSVRAVVRETLQQVKDRITYFGRAESICEVSVEEDLAEEPPEARAVLRDDQPCRQIGPACRDVFCPNPADFQASDLWKRRNDDAVVGAARKHLVQDLIDAPQPLPDGAAWYSYRMPAGWPQEWVVRVAKSPRRRQKRDRIVAHFLEFSLQCRIPVPVKHTVSIAEMFRDAAIRIHGDPSFALSGHDRPDNVEGDHLHAFYLPQPNGAGQDLVRLQVRCSYGFTQREVNALMSVDALPWAGGRFPARPVLLRLERNVPEPSQHTVWQSLTPFVPPRYWYRKKFAQRRVREPDSPENQLRRSLTENGLDASSASIVRVAVANTEWDVCKVHLPKHARSANAEPDRRIGVFLGIEFPHAVRMPLPSFGHSCHFGLGQFSPT
ncbi:MAG: type I-G CRISPR-associated protein Csb2 [Planctomycetota bacterium]